MADAITLPPLPEPYTGLATNLKDMIRARDIEVARLVLEAAADFMKMEGFGGYAIAIRALEVRRHE